mmetsp:Transcript_44314/g.96147  ORF Transcript_44314/g.96147 Transcript_44314/m.96147 type:complete len:303 (+) Transcript_44314:566-1474(+)
MQNALTNLGELLLVPQRTRCGPRGPRGGAAAIGGADLLWGRVGSGSFLRSSFRNERSRLRPNWPTHVLWRRGDGRRRHDGGEGGGVESTTSLEADGKLLQDELLLVDDHRLFLGIKLLAVRSTQLVETLCHLCGPCIGLGDVAALNDEQLRELNSQGAVVAEDGVWNKHSQLAKRRPRPIFFGLFRLVVGQPHLDETLEDDVKVCVMIPSLVERLLWRHLHRRRRKIHRPQPLRRRILEKFDATKGHFGEVQCDFGVKLAWKVVDLLKRSARGAACHHVVVEVTHSHSNVVWHLMVLDKPSK